MDDALMPVGADFEMAVSFADGQLAPGWRRYQALILITLAPLSWILHGALERARDRCVRAGRELVKMATAGHRSVQAEDWVDS
ncbi:MAG: hypothetical protein AAGF27_11935, partial [Pseudomonadota bacterium]